MAKTNLPNGVAAQIASILAGAKPAAMSERSWLQAAGVNTSFFTDIRNGTDPSIGKVERLARAAGLTLAELIDGVEPPAEIVPSEDRLTAMLELVQKEVPANVSYGDWPRYAASALRERLVQFQSAGKKPGRAAAKANTPAEGAQSRAPTKRAGPA